MKNILYVLTFLLAAAGAQAQHDVHYSMFMFNKLALNPAVAGSKDMFTMSAHYRNQWSGIEGAPTTFTFSGHSPVFSKRTGLGLTLTADKIGIIKTYYSTFSYAYRLKIDKESTLSLGFNGHLEYGQVDWGESDPLYTHDSSIPLIASSKLSPNFGVGAYFQTKNYYVGASMPRFFKTNFHDLSSVEYVSSYRTIYLMGGYLARLSDNVRFQPALLLTFNQNAPFDIDMNASFIFMDKFWVGLSYRLEDSIAAVFQLQLNKQLKAALALDLTLSELSNYSPGSIEVMLQYFLVKKGKRLDNIRYFF